MLTKLLKLVKEKYSIDKKQDWYKGSITYFDGLKDEINEVKEELKENNSVYLEDELSDILWTYLNFLKGLKEEGKIKSMKSVIQRCEKKYNERLESIKGQKNGIKQWNKRKEKQKKELKKEHKLKYKK